MNYQNAGRELMTPDEVRMLDNRYAILFMRGERPILDLKYDVTHHPNVKLTPDGGGNPYIHGVVRDSVASVSFSESDSVDDMSAFGNADDYNLVSEKQLADQYGDEIKEYRARKHADK